MKQTGVSYWKTIFLLFVIVLVTVYALPNLYGDDPALQIASKEQASIGVTLTERVAQLLDERRIRYRSIEKVTYKTSPSLLVRFYQEAEQLRARQVLLHILGDQYSIAIQLATKTPAWLRAIGATPMKLGLDLRGGVHFLLAVDTENLLRTRRDSDLRMITQCLRKKHIHYANIHKQSANTLRLSFRDTEARQKAQEALVQLFTTYTFTRHDTANRYLLDASLQTTQIHKMLDYAIEQTMTTLRHRVNELGISEAIVQRQGKENISVDLPGIQDTAQAKDLLGKTATLRFHLVDHANNPEQVVKTGILPPESQLQYYRQYPLLLKNTVLLTGHAITYASAVMRDGRPAVNIHLDSSNEQRHFSEASALNIGKALAVVYVEVKHPPTPDTSASHASNRKSDKPTPIYTQRVISVATIQSALGHNFDITGLASLQYASKLALLLRSGSLPAPVHIVEERTIGPSLGQDNIHKGVLAVVIGSLLVFLFMLLYYHYFGLVANFALVINILCILAVLSLLGATLTLPGIAGIVLTVGMAIDANVLINERIREELRRGHSPLASIQAGYQRAFATIVDANVTTLIVALILYTLGSGAVKGFAVTLTVGLLTSMFTAVFLTRACIDATYHRQGVNRLSIGI